MAAAVAGIFVTGMRGYAGPRDCAPRPPRRRSTAPRAPNPASMRLQAAGSGAGEVRKVPDAELRVTPAGKVNPIVEVLA